MDTEHASGAARDVTLVIPAHNAERTIEACLDAACAIRDAAGSRLVRILLVDDASTDLTTAAARARGVEVLASPRRGAGAARNEGLRVASTEFVWFVDSDCVANPDALDQLLARMRDGRFASVGGTYSIAPGATLLERLIHEEIMVRHSHMGEEVDFQATFNVLYRRDSIASLGGFDERYLKGQDAELAFRMLERGLRLGFERRSVVQHFHADRLSRYLRVQRAQGYWRVALHLEHRGHVRGDNYSSLLDHLQPLAAFLLASSFAAWLFLTASRIVIRWMNIPVPESPEALRIVRYASFSASLALLVALLAMQLPMTLAMMRRAGLSMLAFVPLGALRAFVRGAGAFHGSIDRFRGAGAIAARRLRRREERA
jgi:glycosyltransferase involved in cell wall biosynthesis